MRRITGNENPTLPIAVGDRNPQFPEPDMLEFQFEPGSDRFMQKSLEIEIVRGGVGWHRCVEKPAAAKIDAAEKTASSPADRD